MRPKAIGPRLLTPQVGPWPGPPGNRRQPDPLRPDGNAELATALVNLAAVAAAALNNLAKEMQRRGEGDLAGSLYRRAAEMLDRFLAPDHPQTARIRANLAAWENRHSVADKSMATQDGL